MSSRRAVEIGGTRYYRPADACRVLGWPDSRRLRRHFTVVSDPELVSAVIRRGPPSPGRPPGWVVDADDVDYQAGINAPAGGDFARERQLDNQYRSGLQPSGSPRGDRLRVLQQRIAELEGAYGAALEHREQLLDEIEGLHRLGLNQVDAQRALLDEMRSFAIASFPEG